MLMPFAIHDWPRTEQHRAQRVVAFQHLEKSDSEPLVLVCLDGQFLIHERELIQREVEQIAESILLVGVFSHPQLRAKEYIPWLNDVAFSAPEEFVIHCLLPWVVRQWSLQLQRERTGIFGFSSGAVCAMALGLKHRGTFDSIAALSLVGSPDQYSDEELTCFPQPQIYLAAGTREKPLCKKSQSFSRRLGRLSIKNHFIAREGAEHQTDFWASELPNVLKWMRI